MTASATLRRVMTRKAPAGARHSGCLDHIPHAYTASGYLCVTTRAVNVNWPQSAYVMADGRTPLAGRPERDMRPVEPAAYAAELVAIADHLTASRARHSAAGSGRPIIDAPERGPGAWRTDRLPDGADGPTLAECDWRRPSTMSAQLPILPYVMLACEHVSADDLACTLRRYHSVDHIAIDGTRTSWTGARVAAPAPVKVAGQFAHHADGTTALRPRAAADALRLARMSARLSDVMGRPRVAWSAAILTGPTVDAPAPEPVAETVAPVKVRKVRTGATRERILREMAGHDPAPVAETALEILEPAAELAPEPAESGGHIGYSWTIEAGPVEVFARGASILRAPLSNPIDVDGYRAGREWWPVGDRYETLWRPLTWSTVAEASADMLASREPTPAERDAPYQTVDLDAPEPVARSRGRRQCPVHGRAGLATCDLCGDAWPDPVAEPVTDCPYTVGSGPGASHCIAGPSGHAGGHEWQTARERTAAARLAQRRARIDATPVYPPCAATIAGPGTRQCVAGAAGHDGGHVAKRSRHPGAVRSHLRRTIAARTAARQTVAQTAPGPVVASEHVADAPAPAAPVLAAVPSTVDGRPACPRCGQTFRKSGTGAEWHRVNRLDCAPAQPPVLTVAV